MFSFRKAALVALTCGVLILQAATSLADVAHEKFANLGAMKYGPGTRIDLSARELNEWAKDEGRIFAPGATRNVTLGLSNSAATGSAMIDFLKLRQAATKEQPGWIAKTLFSGERQVIVTVHFQSHNRRARVDIDRVEVSGVAVEGRVLDFLIENWLRPTFPNLKINEWFDIGSRVDRFTVSPGGVAIFVGK